MKVAIYTENELGRIRPTRFKLLGVQQQGKLWRVIDKQTGKAIGPQYPDSGELLADLYRVAEVYGY